MKISKATYEFGKLILETSDIEARRIPYDFKSGDYELVKSKKKRSLGANAYCWVLCSQIADALRISKEDVYRRNIKEGNQFTPMPIRADAVDEFCRIWAGHGIGWFAEVADDSKIDGYKLIFAYHGSSVYTTAEMAQLIDRLIQDATSIGIEVISDIEKSLLLENWDK